MMSKNLKIWKKTTAIYLTKKAIFPIIQRTQDEKKNKLIEREWANYMNSSQKKLE